MLIIKNQNRLIDSSLFTLTDSSGTLNLFSLAIPMFFQLAFNLLLGTVNTVVLTRVSEDAVTAVNVANMIIDIPTNLISMVTSGTLIILSLFLGAGKHDEVKKIFPTGISATALFSGVISVFLFATARPLLSCMNISGVILDNAVLYFKIRIVFLFFTATTNCITAVLRAHGFAKATMLSGILTNTVNAGVSLFIVSPYYSGNKISGVAFAAALGQTAGLVYAVTALLRHQSVNTHGSFSFALLRRILAVGIPGGMSLFAFSVSSAFSTSIVASLGQDAVNIKVYTFNISHYTYLFGYAVAQSVALMIGRYAGAKKYDCAGRLFKFSGIFIPAINACLAAVVLIFATPLIKIFTDNTKLIATAHIIFLMDIAIEIARGNTHIGEGSLCAVADTAFTSAISIGSGFLIGVLCCRLFCIDFGLEIYGFYIASLLDESFRGIVYRVRWNKGRWKLSLC